MRRARPHHPIQVDRRRIARARLGVAACVALIVSACGDRAPAPSARPVRPNVVLVSVDTLRADHLSLYGYGRDTSPFLRSLATEAMVFENAYTQSNFTLISHASLLSSLFPATHGVVKDRALDDSTPLLAPLLQAAGYATAGFYGVSWLDPGYGFGRGFERYEFHPDGATALQNVFEFVDAAAVDPRPFFAFVHLFDVHCGPLDTAGAALYDAPQPFRDRFLPHPEVDTARYLPRAIWLGRVDLEPADAANVLAQYDGGVLYVDSLLERLVGHLKRQGAWDDTLFVITADHGESLGDRGRYSNHGFLWEEGLHVPLVVRLPAAHAEHERPRGTRIARRVQLVDVVPTILAISGSAVPAELQGRDLLDPTARDIVAVRGASRALIRGDHKLLSSGGSRGRELLGIREPDGLRLFDLATDPGETRPLEGEHAELARAMQRDLEGLLAAQLEARKGDADRKMELDDDQRRRLEALGYAFDK